MEPTDQNHDESRETSLTGAAPGLNSMNTSGDSISHGSTDQTYDLEEYNLYEGSSKQSYDDPLNLKEDMNQSTQNEKRGETTMVSLYQALEQVMERLNTFLAMVETTVTLIGELTKKTEELREAGTSISDWPVEKLPVNCPELQNSIKVLAESVTDAKTLLEKMVKAVQMDTGSKQKKTHTSSSNERETAEPIAISTRCRKNDHPDGRYIMTLKSKKKLVANPHEIFNEAVKNISIHVDKVQVIGLDGVFNFKTEKDFTLAKEALAAYLHEGKRIPELYELEVIVKSDYLIRTQRFGLETLKNLPFFKDGVIDVATAANVLSNRNQRWFPNEKDVIGVQVAAHEDTHVTYVLQIFMTKNAHRRVLDGIKQGTRLDVKSQTFKVHEPARVVTCFKCHKPGHIASQCDEPFRCKHCGGNHPIGKCKSRDDPSTLMCFHCDDFNRSLAADEQHKLRKTNHSASSAACPTNKAHRKKAIALKQNEQRKKRRSQ